jgi:hypothetical protein
MNFTVLIAAIFFWCTHAADHSHHDSSVEAVAQSLAAGNADAVVGMLKPLGRREFLDTLMDGFVLSATTNPDGITQAATAAESLVPNLISERFVTFCNKHKTLRARPAYVTELLARQEKFNHLFSFFIERRLGSHHALAPVQDFRLPFFTASEETFLKNINSFVSFKVAPHDIWQLIERRIAKLPQITQQDKRDVFVHILKCFPASAISFADSNEELFNQTIKDARIWDIEFPVEAFDRIKAGLSSMPSQADAFRALYEGVAESPYDRLRYYTTQNERRVEIEHKKALMKELFIQCFDQPTAMGTTPLMHYVSSYVENVRAFGQHSPFNTDVVSLVKEFLVSVTQPAQQRVLCEQVGALLGYLSQHSGRIVVAQDLVRLCFDYLYNTLRRAPDSVSIHDLYTVLPGDVKHELGALVIRQFKEGDLLLSQICLWSSVLPEQLIMNYMPQERDIARIICMANALTQRPDFLTSPVFVHQLEQAFLRSFGHVSQYHWRMYTADVCDAVMPLRSFVAGLTILSTDGAYALSEATQVLLWLLGLETEIAHYKDLIAAPMSDLGAQADSLDRIRDGLMDDNGFINLLSQIRVLPVNKAIERVDAAICMLNEALSIVLRHGITDALKDDALHGISMLSHLFADSCTFLQQDAELIDLRATRCVNMLSSLMHLPIDQAVDKAAYMCDMQWAMLSHLTPDLNFYTVIFNIFEELATKPFLRGAVMRPHRLLQLGLAQDYLITPLSQGRLQLRAHIQQLLTAVDESFYRSSGVLLLRDILRDTSLSVDTVRDALVHIDRAIIDQVEQNVTHGMFLGQLRTEREIIFLPDLLALGIDINARSSHQQTALMQGALWGNLPLVRSLIDYGAQVSLQDDFGRTALGYALVSGISSVAEKSDMLAWLVAADQSVLGMSTGPEQLTPLMLFIKDRVEGFHLIPEDEMVALSQRLLDLGLRPEVLNAYHETAADIAYRGALQQVGQLLCQRMYAGSDFLDYGQAVELVDSRVGVEVPLHVMTHLRDQMRLLFTYEHTKIRRELIEREIAQAVGQVGSASSSSASIDRIIDADGRRQFMTFGSYRKLLVSGSLHQFLRAQASTSDMREVLRLGTYIRQSLVTSELPGGRLLTFDDYPAVDPVTQEGLQISLEQFHELLEHTEEGILKERVVFMYTSVEAFEIALQCADYAQDAIDEQKRLYARGLIDLGCLRDLIESAMSLRPAKHRKLQDA